MRLRVASWRQGALTNLAWKHYAHPFRSVMAMPDKQKPGGPKKHLFVLLNGKKCGNMELRTAVMDLRQAALLPSAMTK